MMTEQQIIDRLIAAHAAYVERAGKQPYLGLAPELRVNASGSIEADVWVESGEHITGRGETFAAVLDALDAAIAAIPSAQEQARKEAAKAVANAIEKCRAAGYDADFANPLVEMSKRISENALTHEAAE